MPLEPLARRFRPALEGKYSSISRRFPGDHLASLVVEGFGDIGAIGLTSLKSKAASFGLVERARFVPNLEVADFVGSFKPADYGTLWVNQELLPAPSFD